MCLPLILRFVLMHFKKSSVLKSHLSQKKEVTPFRISPSRHPSSGTGLRKLLHLTYSVLNGLHIFHNFLRLAKTYSNCLLNMRLGVLSVKSCFIYISQCFSDAAPQPQMKQNYFSKGTCNEAY